MSPHLYVLYTISGEEEKVIELLYATEIVPRPEPDQHFLKAEAESLFIPKAAFHWKRSGESFVREKPLYPGYTFFQTSDPVSFYNRLRARHFFSLYGKHLRVLRRGDYEKSEYDDELMGRISDDEEREILGYCGLERSPEGNIIRKNTGITPDEKNLLKDLDIRIDDVFGKSDLFTATTSHAVKIVQGEGAQRKSQLLVIDGPLKGKEKNIIKADAHKRIAVLRTEFMHTDAKIYMPLEVVKTVNRP